MLEREASGLAFLCLLVSESVTSSVRMAQSRSLEADTAGDRVTGREPPSSPLHENGPALNCAATKLEQLLTMDILVLATMKNAAKCDT